MSSTAYSIFVPRMFANIHEERIRHVFKTLNIGDVNKVDLVARTNKNGATYNMAFIHFHGLYNTESAKTFKQDVENPDKQAKLVYEDPWFWLVLPFEQKDKPSQKHNLHTTNSASTGFTNQFSTPPYYNSVQNMIPILAMTPHGPMWQWGYAPTQPRMVPPQVMYGNKINQYRRHPKKRINAPTHSRAQYHEQINDPTTLPTEYKEDGEC